MPEQDAARASPGVWCLNNWLQNDKIKFHFFLFLKDSIGILILLFIVPIILHMLHMFYVNFGHLTSLWTIIYGEYRNAYAILISPKFLFSAVYNNVKLAQYFINILNHFELKWFQINFKNTFVYSQILPNQRSFQSVLVSVPIWVVFKFAVNSERFFPTSLDEEVYI